MLLPNPAELRRRSRESRIDADQSRRLVLIHAGVIALVSLLLSAVNYYLQLRIEDTGGLAGIGLRSTLSNIQSTLGLLVNAAMPFWTVGYLYIALQQARGRNTEQRDLLTGFRLFFPVLRLQLLLVLMTAGVLIGCLYGGMMILTMTPLADGLYAVTEPILSAGGDLSVIDPALLLDAMAPLYIGCLVILLLVAVPYLYQLRLATYVLLDNPSAGAMHAIRESRRLLRGNRFRLFRLDLHFWWYYAAQLLLTLLAYGDLLLALAGIELSPVLGYFFFLILSQLLQLGLCLWMQSQVQTTYAHAYLSALEAF